MTSAERIRVGILVPHTGMSGAEANIASLLHRLPARQFDVHVIAPETQPLSALARSQGFNAQLLRFPRFFSTSLEIGQRRILNPAAALYDLLVVLYLSVQIARIARRHRLQVLYTGSMMAHLIAALMRLWRRQTRAVIHMQEIVSSRFAGGLGRLFTRLMTSMTDRTVVISKAVAGSLPPSERVTLIYNGVDPAPYESVQASTLRRELHIGPETALVGVVGRLTPWKGHRVFLEAASQLIQADLDCHFVVVGDSVDPVTGESPYRQALEAYCASLKLEAYVTFTGFRQDIPNIMHGLDILVVPSVRPEPFGLVAIEAMSCGKPVVASDGGGLPEIVIDGVTGRLFTPGDAGALAEALHSLIQDPALRRQYGEAGRRRARDHFTLEQYLTAFEAIFRELARQTV